MKNLKSLFTTVVLTLVLTLPAFAGQMTTTITDPPPSPPSATVDGQMTTTVTGQIGTGSSEAVDPVTQVALSLLQSVMSLF